MNCRNRRCVSNDSNLKLMGIYIKSSVNSIYRTLEWLRHSIRSRIPLILIHCDYLTVQGTSVARSQRTAQWGEIWREENILLWSQFFHNSALTRSCKRKSMVICWNHGNLHILPTEYMVILFTIGMALAGGGRADKCMAFVGGVEKFHRSARYHVTYTSEQCWKPFDSQ